MVLNAEQAYAAIPKDELKQYQNTFIFFFQGAPQRENPVTAMPLITGNMSR